jgi:hypothetical protein
MARKNVGFYTAYMLRQGLPERMTENRCYAVVCYPDTEENLSVAYYILAAEDITCERCLFTVWIEQTGDKGFFHRSTSDSFEGEDAEWTVFTEATTLAEAKEHVANLWQVAEV